MKNTKQAQLFIVNGRNYLFPFILITTLFLIWGFAHSLLDVLNKHFQVVLGVSKMESGFIQAAVYGGYFLAALPAGLFIKRYGFKKGIILGLLLVAAGSFLFIPASGIRAFWAFLLALFIIACGLASLETAANPYTTVLGPKRSAARRINLAQSFNAVGWILGPLIGSAIILAAEKGEGKEFSSLAIPYMGLGIVVLLVGLFFYFTKLPDLVEEDDDDSIESIPAGRPAIPFWKQRHFRLAVVAQFFYVAAQTGVNSFFINYVTEALPVLSDENAGYILAFGGMGMFWLGRLSGSYLMGRWSPVKLLSLYAFMNIIMMALVVAGLGWISVVALFSTYFFMSIMFPTIFALGIKDLGRQAKQASSYIVMAIIGGALCPPLMGWMADVWAMNVGFILPLICFGVVLMYGLQNRKEQEGKGLLE
ncbi:MAG: L-fucose:H+ symporter permease [Bacteroidales bacterium]|nr:L-fucose:H+ symporter permease [Bacteroidales bacterium]